MEEIKDILKEFEENDNLENNDTLTSDSEFTDSRSLILKEYLRKYIIPGIDNDITGETLLTHSGYLRDNDVRIIQWIKHMYIDSLEIRDLLKNEKAICLIVNHADKEILDLQINNKDVTPKEMETIIKRSIKYVNKELGRSSQALLDYSGMKWYIKLKNKILEYFYKK